MIWEDLALLFSTIKGLTLKDTASKNSDISLSEEIAQRIREKIISADFVPGQRLAEVLLSEELSVSRNTLREAFRFLVQEGLLEYKSNRGVFVIKPDSKSVTDIYLIRKIIECQALLEAFPAHAAVRNMRRAVDQALCYSACGDWNGVGTANMDFHRSIVELANSQRLSQFYRSILAELRLIFVMFNDPEHLHLPFITMNQSILSFVEDGDIPSAVSALRKYLRQSEKMLLDAF
ncbi:GntR family transcriptional regulator [Serratia marcescens]|nr:GntR family transcriptional regulator [Serratia marcescens]MBH2865968.1 GntR family transcriptional regulator [Serratia marcescens]